MVTGEGRFSRYYEGFHFKRCTDRHRVLKFVTKYPIPVPWGIDRRVPRSDKDSDLYFWKEKLTDTFSKNYPRGRKWGLLTDILC